MTVSPGRSFPLGTVVEGGVNFCVRDVRLDPFSPGLEPFTRIPKRKLATLRMRMFELLETLERADGAWNDFYVARRRAFQAQPQRTSELDTDAATSSPTARTCVLEP
jgi:hypothetical protein